MYTALEQPWGRGGGSWIEPQVACPSAYGVRCHPATGGWVVWWAAAGVGGPVPPLPMPDQCRKSEYQKKRILTHPILIAYLSTGIEFQKSKIRLSYYEFNSD